MLSGNSRRVGFHTSLIADRLEGFQTRGNVLDQVVWPTAVKDTVSQLFHTGLVCKLVCVRHPADVADVHVPYTGRVNLT